MHAAGGICRGDKNIMDQDRRDAQAWAKEWSIRRKNMRIVGVVAAALILIAFYHMLSFITIHATRTTYGSEEEMRAALQGRFEVDKYEDIVIEGDDITLTYYDISHYDKEYAERYGYGEYGDSVYDDRIIEWDYRHGVIKCEWMSDITVTKDGALRYYEQNFWKTDKPKPEPFDPSILKNPEGTENSDEMTEEEQAAEEAVEENRQETEGAAEDAGVPTDGTAAEAAGTETD